MTRLKIYGQLLLKSALVGSLLVLVLSNAAFAAEGAADWRPTYDTVMRWVNFAILAGILFKFGRKPLMNFLKTQKSEIEQEFAKIEAQKESTLAKVREAREALEESKIRLPEIKARLIEQGERRKQEMIQEAQEQSRLILEGAKHKIDYQVLRAREKLRVELLDMAVDEALKELPDLITPEDNQRQIKKFLAVEGMNSSLKADHRAA
jgi:F-type H+-transporting ATPase subunit b